MKNNGSVNVNEKYKELTKDFCSTYYKIYDEQFSNLHKLYRSDAKFTYIDEEFSGFDSLLSRINGYNIFKFNHHSISANGQPINNNSLLLNITGTLSINTSPTKYKFSETLFLQCDNNNKFNVCNTIFKFIDN
jgi:hypothetical protein